MSQKTLIDRPPRIQPDLPEATIDVATPPEKPGSSRLTLLQQIALPLLTIVGFIMMAFLGSRSGSPWLILPMTLSIVASAAIAWYSYRQEKQKKAQEIAAYEAYLLQLREELNEHHESQRHFYRYTYPDPDIVARIVTDLTRPLPEWEVGIRSGTRLWERRPSDEDFGALRIGLGTRRSTVKYRLPQVDNVTFNPLVQKAQRLVDDSYFLDEIAVTIPFCRPWHVDETKEEESEEENLPERKPVAHTIHSLGVSGDPHVVYAFIRALLLQYVTLHSPHDAHLYITGAVSAPWSWTTDLPHAARDEQSEKIYFLANPESHAPALHDEERGLSRYLEALRKLLAQRRIQLQEMDQSSEEVPDWPFLLIVVDLLHATDVYTAFRNIETEATITILQQEASLLRAAVIFLVPERSKIPGGCIGVVEIAEAPEGPIFRYAETGVNSRRYLGRADTIAERQTAQKICTILSQLDVYKLSGGVLANTVSFLELQAEADLRALRRKTSEMWERSVQPEHAGALRVPIGYMSGNKPRTLVLSAKRDGVHGVVAGTTGSGKSELLISMIAALAIEYDPSMLNLVLVDYKGGGAFEDFRNLPHCVDVITNLQQSGVARMFTAINAELKRRQKLNVATDTKDIVEYHQRGFHLTSTPYPYLFIIIDEFAEMLASNKQFKGELETITRLGRAQGVSLLLAAQRPTGITDQMRSNIKYRICLRVETVAESREILRRSEAAFLPGNVPGRGYLQSGNEEIEMIQAAYTGMPYHDPLRSRLPNVIWPDREPAAIPELETVEEPPKLYKALIDMVADLALIEGCAAQRAPWPEPLPKPGALSLINPLSSSAYLKSLDAITYGEEAWTT